MGINTDHFNDSILYRSSSPHLDQTAAVVDCFVAVVVVAEGMVAMSEAWLPVIHPMDASAEVLHH